MALRLTAPMNLINSFLKMDWDKLMQNVFKSTSLQQDILDLNRIDQLYEDGIMADESHLPNYHPKTVTYKKDKGQTYDHMTLNDTGDFYSKFKFKAEREDFIITADTIKKGESNKDYGKIIKLSNGKHVISSVKASPDSDLADYGEILGLTPHNKNIMYGWLKAPFMSEMRKAVFK